ncbi:MAG: hypothetical protein E7Z92_07655 [Cyanobacteria bacterium SIG31]|nr:hypothetical protein [Cyanobacteria bacterium SIG31]
MAKLSILDCTLRDGAYIVDGNFGKNIIKGIITNLIESKIDIIEVGWLKNSPHNNNSTYYEYIEEIFPYLPEKKGESLISVMFDYGRYDINKLSPNENNLVDAIRLVFPKEKHIEAIRFSNEIKQKGYKLYLQAANTLEYTEEELILLAKETNKIKPVAISIVDTFGVMYEEDLKKVFSILDKHLDNDIQIGFHSHNNLQLSFALSISFINMTQNSSRNIIIDSSLVGMGRGAGNTCTELLTNYTNKYLNTNYDYNCIMDTIDLYMKKFVANYNWGYSIPFCIAGQLGSHVNNIAYLQDVHKTEFKDMKMILEMLPTKQRKFYNYDNLEEYYVKYFDKKIDDKSSITKLKEKFSQKKVLLICPGKSIEDEKNTILKYIEEYKPLIISINSFSPLFDYDYLFFSNKVRFDYANKLNSKNFNDITKIITSNIKTVAGEKELLINYNSLMQLGWKYFDNSTMMILRLLEKLDVKDIAIAGFDGLDENGKISYNDDVLQSNLTKQECIEINKDVQEMFTDFKLKNKNILVQIITKSKYI